MSRDLAAVRRESLRTARANRYGDGRATKHGATCRDLRRLQCAVGCPWASDCQAQDAAPAGWAPGVGDCWRLPALRAAIEQDVRGCAWISPQDHTAVRAYAEAALRALMMHLYLLQVYIDQGAATWAQTLAQMHRPLAKAETALERLGAALLLTPAARAAARLPLLEAATPPAAMDAAARPLELPALRPAVTPEAQGEDADGRG